MIRLYRGKFIGWNKDESDIVPTVDTTPKLNRGDWVYGNIAGNDVIHDDQEIDTTNNVTTGFSVEDCGIIFNGWWRVDPQTVGQCVYNDNSVTIFEGDVIVTDMGFGIVTIDPNDFFAGIVTGHDKDGKIEWGLGYRFDPATIGYIVSRMDWRLVGNIHDNPDIMEQTAQQLAKDEKWQAEKDRIWNYMFGIMMTDDKNAKPFPAEILNRQDESEPEDPTVSTAPEGVEFEDILDEAVAESVGNFSPYVTQEP